MHTVGAFEAKTHFSALLERIEKGEQIIITKHGHPVAKLVPTVAVNREQARQAIQRLKKFSQSNLLGGLDWKTLRDEGRR
jgi:prevent-host-death family protein